MATALDIITRAYRKLGIGGATEALRPEQESEGVVALNAMMHGWRLRGVNIGPIPTTSAETFTVPQEYHEGMVYLLASRLAPDYEVPQSFDADDWFRTFQAANIEIQPVKFDTGITRVPSQYYPRSRLRR